MLTYLLVALGLSMDAFAVSVGSGVCIPDLTPRYALRASLAFGLFQFMMPVAGWLAGQTFRAYIEGLDHWIAFGLLAFIGGKMVAESFKHGDPDSCSDDERRKTNILDFGTLMILSVATSIDALAVGISFALIEVQIWTQAAVIGVVTALLTALAFQLGCRLGHAFGKRMDLLGGLVLIAIGVKILIEHLK